MSIDLVKLSSEQRRCLRILSKVPDVAHAARRLHWSQAALKSVLAELLSLLGQRHICISENRVELSVEMREAIHGSVVTFPAQLEPR